MATIYRFIIEQRQSGAASGGTGRSIKEPQASVKTVAKNGRVVSLFGGEKGGVEHNRKLRAINQVINRMTGGVWEKGMRIGRAGLGLFKVNTETGKMGLSGPAVAIIIAFVLQILMKQLQFEQQRASKLNAQNFKMLENGVGAVHGQYKITANILTGRHTYNQNK